MTTTIPTPTPDETTASATGAASATGEVGVRPMVEVAPSPEQLRAAVADWHDLCDIARIDPPRIVLWEPGGDGFGTMLDGVPTLCLGPDTAASPRAVRRSVMAHELAHHLLGHNTRNGVWTWRTVTRQVTALAVLAAVAAAALGRPVAAATISMAALVVLSIVYTATGALARRRELDADAYAAAYLNTDLPTDPTGHTRAYVHDEHPGQVVPARGGLASWLADATWPWSTHPSWTTRRRYAERVQETSCLTVYRYELLCETNPDCQGDTGDPGNSGGCTCCMGWSVSHGTRILATIDVPLDSLEAREWADQQIGRRLEWLPAMSDDLVGALGMRYRDSHTWVAEPRIGDLS